MKTNMMALCMLGFVGLLIVAHFQTPTEREVLRVAEVTLDEPILRTTIQQVAIEEDPIEVVDTTNPCDNLPPLSFIDTPRRHKYAVALASFPGSGNTWARHVIQQGSRVFTGSIYNDLNITKAFPGEGRVDASVSVVKTHFPCAGCWTRLNKRTGVRTPVPEAKTGDLKKSGATVYLLRNPFDALLAEFNREFTGFNHTGVASESLFQGEVRI